MAEVIKQKLQEELCLKCLAARSCESAYCRRQGFEEEQIHTQMDAAAWTIKVWHDEKESRNGLFCFSRVVCEFRGARRSRFGNN